MQKKLTRIKDGRQICGVCGGIARYFDLDPTVIRVLWVILTLFGPGILAYIICALIMPEETHYIDAN